MNPKNIKLPKGWVKLITPGYYKYKDFIIKRIDRPGGEIELTTRDFVGKRYKVISDELFAALNKMEQPLKES